QDDKGRLRWTLFGGSEQGPGRAFWRGFFTAPHQEVPAEEALDFIRRLLCAVYGEALESVLLPSGERHRGDGADLRRAGFRILPMEDQPRFAHWREDPWPSWAKQFFWAKGRRSSGVKYLLTFRAFANLPPAIQRAYLAGELHLLPFPGSLVPWGVQGYEALTKQLTLALQIPLLLLAERRENPHGLRVPQSGWMHEAARPGGGDAARATDLGPHRGTYKRTHRWARVHRHEDELSVLTTEDRIAHVLFSTDSRDLGLYGKPMARNGQIWTAGFRTLLDGPNAGKEELQAAARALAAGGTFGYRFEFPAMRVGRHQIYWHRPLV